MDWTPLLLTLKLAVVTTLILFVIGLPLAWWLSRTRFPGKPVIEAVVSLPLVLPPSVLGFYLLVAFSPENSFGAFLRDTFGLRLVFSFAGLVVASVIYSFPFMVQPLQAGFQSVPRNLREAAETLGKSRFEILRHVLLPNMKSSVLTALVLSFAHTIGEFGVVLMIGGSLPGRTRVASIAVYDEVESLNYAAANRYALVLLLFSFVILVAVYTLNRHRAQTLF
ncbi:MAG: molybdate ABC transporter permease subunit [Bacteroidota bacterium]